MGIRDFPYVNVIHLFYCERSNVLNWRKFHEVYRGTISRWLSVCVCVRVRACVCSDLMESFLLNGTLCTHTRLTKNMIDHKSRPHTSAGARTTLPPPLNSAAQIARTALLCSMQIQRGAIRSSLFLDNGHRRR